MTREEAKELFRQDRDAYGKPRKIMTKIDKIYDDFENRVCRNCKLYVSIKCPVLEIESDETFCCNKFIRGK